MLASLGLVASALTVAAAPVPAWAQNILIAAPAVGTDSNGHEYLFWRNANNGLETAKFTDRSGWDTPSAVTVDGHGMGPLGSEPTVAVDYNTGYQYVYWEGTDQGLWEAWYNQNGWHGPKEVFNANHGSMGPLGSPPNAVWDAGRQYIFWINANNQGLEYAYFDPTDGTFHGPQQALNNSGGGMGPLGSAPAGGVALGNADQYQWVVWEGTESSPQLWYATDSGGSWIGPTEAKHGGTGMGPLGSQPTVCLNPDGTAIYVVWTNTGSDLEFTTFQLNLWQAPKPVDVGPLNSAPAITCGTSIRVFWMGTNGDLWGTYSTNGGSTWANPADQKIYIKQ